MSGAAALLSIAFFCLMIGWISAAMWLGLAAIFVLVLWSVVVVTDLVFGPPPRR